MFKKQSIILILAIIIYIAFFTTLCLLKYSNFLYQGLDLSIINQVFHNLANFNSFSSAIQNQSYLGDHFSPIIILLLPFYYFFQSPKTLLILQTIILSLGAIPVYLIAKEKLRNKNLALIISIIFLCNPALHSINLYEFSFLSFAVFLLLITYYFFQKKMFRCFIFLVFLCLLVREDLSLIMFMFGIYALLKKRSLKWVLPPIIISIIYFLLSLKIISYFNVDHVYKFLIHYSWLGNSIINLIANFFLKLPQVLLHFLNLENLIFILYLLIPVFFLPIFGKKTLIFFVPILLQFGLANSGFKGIFFTHYLALFIPFIFIATIYGLSRILSLIRLMPSRIQSSKTSQKITPGKKEYIFIIFLLIFITIASNIGFSPSYNLSKKLINLDQQESKNKQSLINEIPKCQCSKNYILATNDFLPALSNNENLYATFYLIKGKKQYSDQDYNIPKLNYALINYEQFYKSCQNQEQLSNNKKICKQGIKRLKKVLVENKLKPKIVIDNNIFYSNNYQLNNSLQKEESDIIINLSKNKYEIMLDESSLEKAVSF
ncbi:MAG: DUF2079 domain-containing protein [Patescibacteria group bacterium]|nr:DUF2079 domain-containing protein [Patescibacteria group bacterium]